MRNAPYRPEADDEDQGQEQDAQQPEAQQSSEMPGIQPLGGDEGTLVYCPTCGMRMQKSTDHCEKCGMRLAGNSPTNSGVPLVNSDPLGGDFSGISDNDIAQINSFVNNSGFSGGIEYNNDGFNNGGIGYNDPGIGGGFGGGNLSSEIEALNQQFANLNSTASDMPAISAPVRQPTRSLLLRRLFPSRSLSHAAWTISRWKPECLKHSSFPKADCRSSTAARCPSRKFPLNLNTILTTSI